MGRSDQLQVVIDLYPEIGDELHRTLKKLHIEKINNRDFKNYKERICIAQSLLPQVPDIEKENGGFLNVILYEDMRHVKESVRLMGKGYEQPKGILNKAWGGINSFISSGPDVQFVDQTFKDAEITTSAVSDAQFLAELDDMEKLPCMEKIIADTRAVALGHFRSLLAKHSSTLTHSALRIQTDKCLAQLHKEAASNEEQELAESRKRFIAEINDLSQTVHHS